MSPCTLALVRRTPHSYTVSDVFGLADWIQAHGYQRLTHRSITEHGRYQRGQSLIICYHSGAVVLQGLDVTSAQQLLGQLVPTPAPQLSLFDDPPGAFYSEADDWTAREVLR